MENIFKFTQKKNQFLNQDISVVIARIWNPIRPKENLSSKIRTEN